MILSILSLIATTILTLSLSLVPAMANPVKRPHTTVSLLAENASVTPGQSVMLALHMEPVVKWHTYWKNYGDSGVDTALEWTLPPGAQAGEIIYPAPSRIPFGADLMNYGYKTASTLLIPVKLPQELPERFTIKAKADWLVCDDEQCVPESAELVLALQKGDGALDPAQQALFAAARAALPKPMAWPSTYSTDQKNFLLQIKGLPQAAALQDAYFFPLDGGVLAHAKPQRFALKDGVLDITVEKGAGPFPDKFDGVLELRLEGAPKAEYFTLSVQRGAVAQNTAQNTGQGPLADYALWQIFAFALLGGFILNLMPCVFPILSLKALSLARSGGENENHAKQDALAYLFGVLLTFGLIGGLLLILRAAGEAIGWGFQLQDPRMVGLLALLMVIIGLNLAGIFEFSSQFSGVGQNLTQKSGKQGAFWTGALAVLVATPCTAPFMGPALGAAVFLPPVLGFSIFLALGLGMALPFVLIGYVPALRKRLPKPGAWMATFKILMAFPMLATALWLFWVLGQQTGPDGMLLGLSAALLLAFGLWLLGRSSSALGKALSIAVAALAVAGFAALPPKFQSNSAAAGQTAEVLDARPFSPEVLSQALAAQTPTFVYFTADWCITCKANERAALSQLQVAEAFKKAGVQVIKADWTKPNAAIAKTLERYGRTGIPLYLWFPAGSTLDNPVILPQVLTPGLLVETVS
jgi:thiol:disulfide interchange protein/DsbC/DsbD-like thiol-disulfide interchange protein